MPMTLVSTVTVGAGGASSIDFASIPQTGKDLLIFLTARSTGGSANSYVTLRFNNTSSTYTARWLYGDSTTVGSSTNLNIPIVGNGAASSTFGSAAFYVSNYTSAAEKQISVDAVTENNTSTNAWQSILAGRWNGTSAITSIQIPELSYSFAESTTASLYIIS